MGETRAEAVLEVVEDGGESGRGVGSEGGGVPDL